MSKRTETKKLSRSNSDDLGKGCKIHLGVWKAPKLYFLEYVEQSEYGEQKDKRFLKNS